MLSWATQNIVLCAILVISITKAALIRTAVGLDQRLFVCERLPPASQFTAAIVSTPRRHILNFHLRNT